MSRSSDPDAAHGAVSLYAWRIPAVAVPAAMWRMAVDPRRVRHQAGVRFVKLLGTGRGSEFGPIGADPTRWAALAVYDRARPAFSGWDRRAVASCRIDLAPLAVRGSWAGCQPFAVQPELAVDRGDSRRPVLALTRARLRPGRAATFWRAIGPVAGALSGAPGLLAAFGIGEAPLGWQGTVSVWRQPTDLARFAYRHPEHRRAIERTAITGWYAEELFARFAVLDVVGDTGVIGWGAEKRGAAKHGTAKRGTARDSTGMPGTTGSGVRDQRTSGTTPPAPPPR